MAFDNKSIKPVHPEKPHICFRDGFWRVSSVHKPHIGAREKFNKAHLFVMKLNDERWNSQVEKERHKARLLKIFGGKFLQVR